MCLSLFYQMMLLKAVVESYVCGTNNDCEQGRDML